jgi:hypothetical protein
MNVSPLSSVRFATIGVIITWFEVGTSIAAPPALSGQAQSTIGATVEPIGVLWHIAPPGCGRHRPPITERSQYCPSGQSMKSPHDVVGVKHEPVAQTCPASQQTSAPAAFAHRSEGLPPQSR